jgi:hypothetical protein
LPAASKREPGAGAGSSRRRSEFSEGVVMRFVTKKTSRAAGIP